LLYLALLTCNGYGNCKTSSEIIVLSRLQTALAEGFKVNSDSGPRSRHPTEGLAPWKGTVHRLAQMRGSSQSIKAIAGLYSLYLQLKTKNLNKELKFLVFIKGLSRLFDVLFSLRGGWVVVPQPEDSLSKRDPGNK